MAVGEVHRIDRAVALRIGEGLQVDHLGREVLDALDQPAEVGFLLARIGVVDVVHVDLHHALHGVDLAVMRERLAQRALQAAGVGVVAHQAAADGGKRRVRCVGAGLQRQHVLQADVGGFLVERQIVRAIGPHHALHLGAGVLLDDVDAALQVAAHALAVFVVGLVAAELGQVAVRAGGRHLVALRVAQHAVVHVVRVRGELHQAGGLDLADLVPVHEEVAPHDLLVRQLDLGPLRRVGPLRHQREDRREAELLEQRKHPGVVALVAVIEGQQDGPAGQRLAAPSRLADLVERDRVVAVGLQPAEHVGQHLGIDGERIGQRLEAGAQVVADVVEAQHAEGLAVHRVGLGQEIHLQGGGRPRKGEQRHGQHGHPGEASSQRRVSGGLHGHHSGMLRFR